MMNITITDRQHMPEITGKRAVPCPFQYLPRCLHKRQRCVYLPMRHSCEGHLPQQFEPRIFPTDDVYGRRRCILHQEPPPAGFTPPPPPPAGALGVQMDIRAEGDHNAVLHQEAFIVVRNSLATARPSTPAQVRARSRVHREGRRYQTPPAAPAGEDP